MIELRPDRMRKAIAKARTTRCMVRMIEFRRYIVTTPDLINYYVRFEARDGKKYATCTCRAGKLNMPCYHLAASYPVHAAIARMRAEAEKPEAAAQPANTNLIQFKPRDVLIRRDCNHQECKTSRCEKGQRIGAIAI